MPAKTKTTKRPSSHHVKRRGQHHRHNKPYLKVYWPYVPMFFLVLVGLIFGSPQTGIKGNVLAYATEMSNGGLLSATNSHRNANGKASLALNSALASAAQAKANDMAARNYWSHNTPDGQEPWVFIDNTGYSYIKAGENLAYGFANSSDTVTGWMNSASHRANMLDGSFTEVGFGFTNSPNYVNNGQQTIVVAMYGQPQVASAQAPAPTQAAPQPSTPAPATLAPAPVHAASEETAAPPPVENTVPAPSQEQGEDKHEDGGASELAIPLTTSNLEGTEPTPVAVSRLETASGGSFAGVALLISIFSAVALLFMSVKHGLAFKRVLVHGEMFILKHPMLDITLVGLIMLSYVVNQTSGFIR